MNPLIQLDGVTVDFPIYNSDAKSFRKSLINAAVGGRIVSNKSVVTVKALDNITLHLNEGDRLGISGHNGAGKSTLLRVMAGVYSPTTGTCKTRGRVVSFLDIMLGMDVEYTGEENIRIRGLLYGLSNKEITKKFDDIVQFSELDDFIKLPMRTYSTGMLMRLAFSIATAIEGDIVLMDEWLSVGDQGFADKASKRLDNYLQNVGVLVLASHSQQLLDSVCNRQIVLEHGCIK